MSNLSRQEQIFEALLKNAQARRAAMPEEGDEHSGAECDFIFRLKKCFPIMKRKTLAEVCHKKTQQNNASSNGVCFQTLALEFMKHGEEVHSGVGECILNRLGREPFSREEKETGRSGINLFHMVSKVTRNDYARRLQAFLRFCVSMEDGVLRDACGLQLQESTLEAIRSFKNSPKTVACVIDFLYELSGQVQSGVKGYEEDLPCSFAIGQLFEVCGKFGNKESGNKTLSALKYSLRMAVMCKVMKLSDPSLVERVEWRRDGHKSFDRLTILQAGVNALPRILKPAAMVVDKECKVISYSGITCSFDFLNNLFHKTLESAKSKLNKLLMGFKPAEEPRTGFSSVPFTKNFAFGQSSESEYGDRALWKHVMSSEEHMFQFFGKRGVRVVEKKARRYLQLCKQYEKDLLVLMHILTACGARATDFQHLTFRDGCSEAERRTVSFYDEKLVHCTFKNNKGSKLKGRDASYSIFLPRGIVDPVFVVYWKSVRPFCLLLQDLLGNRKAYNRWQRYCFVQASNEKWVRKTIKDAFSHATTPRSFQWVRHACNFLLKMYVRCSDRAAFLPVYKLFGHSEETDKCYAVEKLSGFSDTCPTNTTDVLLILRQYWLEVGLDTSREMSCKEDNTELDHEDPSENSYASEAEESMEDGLEHSACGESQDQGHIEIEDVPENCASLIEEVEDRDDGDALVNDEDDDDEEVTTIHDVEHSASGDSQDGGQRTNNIQMEGEDVPQSCASLIAEDDDCDDSDDEFAATDEVSKLGFSSFKSQAQMELVKHIARRDQSVLGVLPTGGGKSLAIFSCLNTSEKRLTVAIFPLLSVLSDVKHRLEKMVQDGQTGSHRFSLWTGKSSASELLKCDTRLVLVSAEQGQDPKFQAFLREARTDIRNVIFDEAPLFTSSAYRRNLALLPLLVRAATSAKFTLLSATVPTASEKDLLKGFGIPRAGTIRMSTVKPNLIHSVVRVPSTFSKVSDFLAFVLQESSSHAVVFVRTVQECEKLAKELSSHFAENVAHYHAQLAQDCRQLSHKKWSSKGARVMVATTAFAFGVDSADCSLVVQVGPLFDLCTYQQAAGRAGRRGQMSKSIIVLPHSRVVNCEDEDLRSYITNRSQCRRVLLSQAFDPSTLTCREVCGQCDNCKRNQWEPGVVHREFLRNSCLVTSSTGTPSEARVETSKRLARARMFSGILKRCLDATLRTKVCFVCFIMKQRLDGGLHGLQECPYYRTGCFRCGQRHRRSSCNVDGLLKQQCSRNVVCVTCCLPCVSLVRSFHLGENTLGRSCRYRDTVIPACMMLWHHEKHEVAALMSRSNGRVPETLEEFTQWITKVEDGLTNAGWLISSWCQSRKIFSLFDKH